MPSARGDEHGSWLQSGDVDLRQDIGASFLPWAQIAKGGKRWEERACLSQCWPDAVLVAARPAAPLHAEILAVHQASLFWGRSRKWFSAEAGPLFEEFNQHLHLAGDYVAAVKNAVKAAAPAVGATSQCVQLHGVVVRRAKRGLLRLLERCSALADQARIIQGDGLLRAHAPRAKVAVPVAAAKCRKCNHAA